MLLTTFSNLIKKVSLSPKLDICIIFSSLFGLLCISFVLVAIATKGLFYTIIAPFSFMLMFLFALIGCFIEKLSEYKNE